MDAIGDADYALHAHSELSSAASNGHLYLAHFGFVQALYLQQVATEVLCSTLDFNDLRASVREELSDIRDVRNDIAHMADRSGGKRPIGIVRMSMTVNTLTRYSFGHFDEEHGDVYEEVNCRELAGRQNAVLIRILTTVLDRLRSSEREHRARFRADPLAPTFCGFHYAIEKLAGGVRGDESAMALGLAIGALNALDGSVDSFVAGLQRRNLVDNWLNADIVAARKALSRMREMVVERREPVDAEAMVLLVQDRVKRLKQYAESCDATYAADP